jgi:type III restriction enzyme
VDLSRAGEEVHDGYFSIDKRSKRAVDTEEGNQTGREAAEQAYNLIMKDKEKLLSFETPLKFIFSHSALREGWDNPNVFQICTLRDIQTERERRQTIGRGLRLCVNQEGQRLRGFDVNTLTVVATESYEQFAQNLQKEIEEETGIRFGIVEVHQFAAVTVTAADGSTAPLGVEQSMALWGHLKEQGYIDARGKVQDTLRTALKADAVKIPEAFAPQSGQITHILRKLAGRLEIKNADERRQVRPRQAILHSPEFKALWDRIKHKTTYRVEFDNETLVESCIKALRDAPVIPKTRLQWRKADLAIGKGGVEATERTGAQTVVLDEADIELPDLLTQLQDRTQLTRRTIYRVLTGSGRLDDFKRNPQAFIELAAEAINRRKRLAIVDGIKYQRLGDEHYYAQELFEQEELTGYLKNMLTETKKSLYERVVYDSGTEADFADGLEKNEVVKIYAKLPGWFTVPTPLGGYNPDWAVLVEKNGTERLYLVVETKSSLFADDLREKEGAKIECGKEHFKALQGIETPARYIVARSVEEIIT